MAKALAAIAGDGTAPGDVEVTGVAAGSVVVDVTAVFRTHATASGFAANLTCCVDHLFLQEEFFRPLGPVETLNTRPYLFAAPSPPPPLSSSVGDVAGRLAPPATRVQSEPEPSPWQKPWFLGIIACLVAMGLALGIFVASRTRNRRVMNLSSVVPPADADTERRLALLEGGDAGSGDAGWGKPKSSTYATPYDSPPRALPAPSQGEIEYA